MPEFLKTRQAVSLTVLLLVLVGVFYGLPKERAVNLAQPLSSFPRVVGDWRTTEDAPIDAEVQSVLQATDTLNRIYQGSDNSIVNLFIAFFKSQSNGVAPHSPKNCLPGSGWTPSQAGTVVVQLPGPDGPIRINRYIVSRGEARSVVLYWYQSRHRVVASEYSAKIYLVLDTMRYHHSDTSIVRVTAPVVTTEENAERDAVNFVRVCFDPIRALLPL